MVLYSFYFQDLLETPGCPGCLLGASRLPPGCLLGASWVPPGSLLGGASWELQKAWPKKAIALLQKCNCTFPQREKVQVHFYKSAIALFQKCDCPKQPVHKCDLLKQPVAFLSPKQGSVWILRQNGVVLIIFCSFALHKLSYSCFLACSGPSLVSECLPSKAGPLASSIYT